jgi:hypothetical protein
MAVDTRTAERRTLRFATLAEALADARAVAQADAQGRLRRTGNWTAGQVLHHLASWINFAYDGYPATPPWFVRLLGPLMRRRVLAGPLVLGLRMPGVKDGTYATEDMPTERALAEFARAVERLSATPPNTPNPVFGRMTHQQWLELHTRHAECHLGFLHP